MKYKGSVRKLVADTEGRKWKIKEEVNGEKEGMELIGGKEKYNERCLCKEKEDGGMRKMEI